MLLLAELLPNLLILLLFLQTTDHIPVKVLLYQSILLLLSLFLFYLHVQTLLHLLVQLAAVFLLLEHQLFFELVPLLLMITHLPLELMIIQVGTLLLHGNRGDTVQESLYALLSRMSLLLPPVVIRVNSRFVVVECTEVVKLLLLLSLLFAHYVFLVLR